MRKLFNADNSPRYIRVWDNGGATLDRYTIQFTQANCFGLPGQVYIMGLSDTGQAGCRYSIDVDKFGMSAREKSSFDKLSADVQRIVIREYVQCWDISLAEMPDVWRPVIYR